MPDVIQIAIQATDLASKVIGGVGDSLDKLDKSADSAEKKLKLFGLSADQIGSKMSQAGKIATIGLTLPIAGISVAAIKAASDLNETANKIDTLFGAASDEIKKFSDTAATSLGQSKKQALDAAATFAVFGKAAGLAGQDLVKFSEQNVTLAADMASFFNTSPEEAITAIGAAFRGESEPIRRYGVLLDDASLKQQALRMGLIKTTTEALQPQQRVLAAQALIMQQTTAAAGDFAKTSGGLANQSRILNAQFQDVIATLGQSLLPIAVKVASTANDLLTAFNNLDQPTKDLIVGFGLMAAAAGPVLTIGGKLIGVFGSLTSVAIDVSGGMLTMAKSVIDVAGTLQRVGVTTYTVRDAIIRLRASGALLTGELGLIIAGLIAVAKYLEQVGEAARASTDDLIEMSHSGDVFKQAAATTEILAHGQDRLKAALDGVKTQLEKGGKTYADYKSSLEATAKAAGYVIDAQGNLVSAYDRGMGAGRLVIKTNYELTESEYAAMQAAHAHGGIIDQGIQLLIKLGNETSNLDAKRRAGVTTTDELYRAENTLNQGVRNQAATYAVLDAAMANNSASHAALAAAQNAAIAAEAAHRASLADSISSVDKLAQSLKDATTAQAIQTLAQGQLDTLKKAYEGGSISAEGLKKATDAVMLSYGLATPKSIAMADAQDKINAAFLAGKLPLDKYIDSTAKIPKIALDGKVTLQELTSLGIEPTTAAALNQITVIDNLTAAWAKIPTSVTTTYTIGKEGIPLPIPPREVPIPGNYQHGANFTVPPGYPNDSFPMRVSSGEHVQVTPQGKGGNVPAINITQNFSGAESSPEKYKSIMYEVITNVFETAMRQ